jgi:hypothetical protein
MLPPGAKLHIWHMKFSDAEDAPYSKFVKRFGKAKNIESIDEPIGTADIRQSVR